MKIKNLLKYLSFTFAFAFGLFITSNNFVSAENFVLSDGTTSVITYNEGQLLATTTTSKTFYKIDYFSNANYNYYSITMVSPSASNYPQNLTYYGACSFDNTNNNLTCTKYIVIAPNGSPSTSSSTNTFIVTANSLQYSLLFGGYADIYPVQSYQEGYNNGYQAGIGANQENIYNDGYNKGYSEGETAGLQTGYNNGYSAGSSDGWYEGYSEGYEEGKTEADNTLNTNSVSYTTGYNNGKTEADNTLNTNSVSYTTGYNNGKTEADNTLNTDSVSYTTGYSNGETAGYRRGYAEGNESRNNLVGMVGAIFSGPVTLLTSIFDFEFLGVNLTSFILSITSLLVVIWLVKKLW